MSNINYWRLSTSSIRFIELGLESKTWGFSSFSRWEHHSKEIKKGDKVVIYYTKDHIFQVICEVNKERFIDNSLIWFDNDYPIRIGIEPLPISQKPIKLREAREFSKRPNLGGSFNPSVAKLTPQDFNIICSMMTEK